MDSDHDKSIDSRAAEYVDDDETSKKLHVDTESRISLVGLSDVDLESPCTESQDSVDTCDLVTSSTCRLDLQKLPFECTSKEPCAVPSSAVADSESGGSDAPGAETAAAAAVSPTAMTPDKHQSTCISEESFYVQLSYVPPIGRSDHFVLSLAEYQRHEFDHINRAKEIIKAYFTNLTIERLRDVGIAEKNCARLANLVMNGEEVKINADKDELHSTEDIYEHYHDWQTIENYQCLLINAPNENEHQQRMDEMRNFCLQAFPRSHFDDARLDQMVTHREIRNCTEVITFIRDFFCRQNGIRAKRGLHAMILFFGHGSPQGFRAGQQDMPLDDIISLVKEGWRESQLRYPVDLPVKVEIIFTQCFGHLHGQVGQNDMFKVTAFTSASANNQLTHSTRDAAGHFANEQLTSYAGGSLRYEVVGMEAWRRSGGDKFIDLSAEFSSHDQPAVPTTEGSHMVVNVNDTGLPSA